MDQETVSHTPVEQANVDRIEDLDPEELRAQFSTLFYSALSDDPNTTVQLDLHS